MYSIEAGGSKDFWGLCINLSGECGDIWEWRNELRNLIFIIILWFKKIIVDIIERIGGVSLEIGRLVRRMLEGLVLGWR